MIAVPGGRCERVHDPSWRRVGKRPQRHIVQPILIRRADRAGRLPPFSPAHDHVDIEATARRADERRSTLTAN